MANQKAFPVGENTAALAAYRKYLEPGQTIETVAASLEVSPNTLRGAFHDRGYRLKVNKKANRNEVIAFQKEARVPVDYLAARFGVQENTIRRWLRTAARVNVTRRSAQAFWDTLAQRCETPAEFYDTLVEAPHSLDPQAIPVLYHKRIRPVTPILWQLAGDDVARELDRPTMHEVAEITEHDGSPFPQMYLGYEGTATPIQWVNEPDTDDNSSSLSSGSDLNMQSILEDI